MVTEFYYSFFSNVAQLCELFPANLFKLRFVKFKPLIQPRGICARWCTVVHAYFRHHRSIFIKIPTPKTFIREQGRNNHYLLLQVTKKQKERKHRKQARNKRPSPFSHTHNLWRRTDRPSPETATDGSYFKFQLRLSRTRTAPLPLSQVENLFRFSHHVALKMACRIFPVFRVNRAGTEPAICYFSCFFLCVCSPSRNSNDRARGRGRAHRKDKPHNKLCSRPPQKARAMFGDRCWCGKEFSSFACSTWNAFALLGVSGCDL